MFPKPTALFLVGLAIIAGPVTAAPGSAGQALEARDTWKSDINVEDACKQQYGGTGELWVPEVVGKGYCDDWKCRRLGEERGLNMDAYCIRRHGNSNAYATCSNGVYNWACWSR